MSKTPIARILANITIWLLIALGFAVHLAFVPAVIGQLTTTYSEYAADALVISALLVTPVALGQIMLFLVFALLRRIHSDRMLTASAFKWVKFLIADAYALAASGVALLTWLSIKNTLPPVILAILLVFSLLALAVALVTTSLLGLLKNATAAKQELEEVI